MFLAENLKELDKNKCGWVLVQFVFGRTLRLAANGWILFCFKKKKVFLYSAEEQHAGEMNSQRSKEWEKKKWGQQVGCLTFSIDLSFC